MDTVGKCENAMGFNTFERNDLWKYGAYKLH